MLFLCSFSKEKEPKETHPEPMALGEKVRKLIFKNFNNINQNAS